ncbi:hypothetical protein AX774_g3325 [Zancudomyces culisetae]|uniref:Uncharacterized protein n=1 Tax=Zancudomyces culisetae TaxID=1213189 RepID=A0A1R1PQM3_ZANCU|nr:hypothetical protein AX774_g3325 [Zancudomyces culisetae]|eukprot:OMH83172.1 hypothetical protein AX774_g3325 [Zancudomyces culisetae]
MSNSQAEYVDIEIDKNTNSTATATATTTANSNINEDTSIHRSIRNSKYNSSPQLQTATIALGRLEISTGSRGSINNNSVNQNQNQNQNVNVNYINDKASSETKYNAGPIGEEERAQGRKSSHSLASYSDNNSDNGRSSSYNNRAWSRENGRADLSAVDGATRTAGSDTQGGDRSNVELFSIHKADYGQGVQAHEYGRYKRAKDDREYGAAQDRCEQYGRVFG